MKKHLFRLTIDIDHHGIPALKAFFESSFLLREHHVGIIDWQTDYTRHGWHILYTVYCTERTYWSIRKVFDDPIRYAIDSKRQDWRYVGVLWTSKYGIRKFEDVDITKMSLINPEPMLQ